MKLYIGADHRGFALKEHIKELLRENHIEYEDVGNSVYDPKDDYPDIADKVAHMVLNDPGSLGIVACGSGVGVDIAANKVHGIRSALAVNATQIREAREDDDVNVLALAADFLKLDELPSMIKVFTEVSFIPSKKHERRLEEITQLEHEI